MKRSSHISEEIQLLIADFLTGTIDATELDKLNQWVSDSKENQDLFNSFLSAWYLSGTSSMISAEETDKALEVVKQSLRESKARRLRPFWNLSRMAASWLIFFIIGGLAHRLFMTPSPEMVDQHSTTTITSPQGSNTLIDLPDGTKVWLNAGSKISYGNSYGISARDVELTGEAYFDVKTNRNMPFVVITSDVVVKALGTRFNVKAYPEEETITATLEEGRIVLTSLHDLSLKESVLIKPKEMVTYYKNNKIIEADTKDKIDEKVKSEPEKGKMLEIVPNIKTELVTSWKDETWIIESQPLGYLIPILERRYDIIIILESDEIMKYKFTGKIQKETIEQIMSAFGLSAPINYRIEKNKITLSLNKNRQIQYNHFTNE